MAKFETESVTDAFERAIRNAKHLRVRDAPLVMAARALARKIDAWDIIVDFAMEDAVERGERPKVPANDNVSIASFLKYLERLQLVPPETEPGGGAAAAPATPADAVGAMRKKLQAAGKR